MDAEDADSGLLGIALSDSEDDKAGRATEQPQPQSREERNAQSEEEFRRLRSSYRVKVENGEIWKTVKLPLAQTVTKPEAQELVHAVEELYFFRRYGEAVDFIRAVWRQGGQEGGGLDGDTRELLGYYERKCAAKMHASS